MNIDIHKLIEVYGSSSDNWGDLPNFAGGYINYGYWKNFALNNGKAITATERVYSSIALYKEVVKKFAFPQENILEIGCGRGIGLVDVLHKLDVKCITAIDINEDQISRAKKNIQSRIGSINNIKIFSAAANNTTLLDNSMDGICSIEAAQHFSSIKDFAVEAARILKPTGKLVFATYFPTSDKYLSNLKELLPLIEENLENMSPISEVCACILQSGFTKVTCESIGKYVFEGYEKWITQKNVETEFSHNYYNAYQHGYIDYYIISACHENSLD